METKLKNYFMKNGWFDILYPEISKDYFSQMIQFLKKEYEIKPIYPPKNRLFAAFDLTKYEDVKVVILGQDPYHGPNQANGLSFSVNRGIKPPPSLKNIFKEINSELNLNLSDNGDLTHWAKQGVLLLNSSLTVEKSQPLSHANIGWENFTDYVIKIINEKQTPVVFLLWGNYAKKKAEFLNNPKHLILKSPHPSPFSVNRGFFGNNHFIKTNEFLIQNGLQPIDWNVI